MKTSIKQEIPQNQFIPVIVSIVLETEYELEVFRHLINKSCHLSSHCNLLNGVLKMQEELVDNLDIQLIDLTILKDEK